MRCSGTYSKRYQLKITFFAKLLERLFIVSLLLTIMPGCATTMWHDNITNKQYIDQGWREKGDSGLYIGLTTRGGKAYHHYIFPDSIWKTDADFDLLLAADEGEPEVIISRVPKQQRSGQPVAIYYYYPIYAAHERRNNLYSYLSTKAPSPGQKTFLKQSLLYSSYPTVIDIRIERSFNSAIVQAGRPFSITYDRNKQLNSQQTFYVPEFEWRQRDWSRTENQFWYDWSEPVTIGELDPKKWNERISSVLYLITVPLDIITLPIMLPFYVFSYQLNRGLSPR